MKEQTTTKKQLKGLAWKEKWNVIKHFVGKAILIVAILTIFLNYMKLPKESIVLNGIAIRQNVIGPDGAGNIRGCFITVKLEDGKTVNAESSPNITFKKNKKVIVQQNKRWGIKKYVFVGYK